MDAAGPSPLIDDQLRALLEASPSAIVAVDGSGRIAYANSGVRATFGYEPDELVGHMMERLLPERLAHAHVAHRDRFLDAPVARPMGIGLDLAARHRDGHEFPVEIALAPLSTQAGILVFATVADISARKSLERQLLQAQKMESVGRLAGGIAHDFNNMVFAIDSYASMLAEDLAAVDPLVLDTSEMSRSVEGIATAAGKASALTGQLLAFSRQQVAQVERRDIVTAVRHVEPMLRRLIGEQIRMSLVLDPATGSAMVDASQLDQVLMNLVVNARDAMPGGGRLTIETGDVVFDEPYAVEYFDVSAGPYVMIAVSDTGIGMDRETKTHVFEPFFTTKEPGRGTGLGLSTVFEIVRRWGGHIWVYSEPGIGTTFKIYLPRVEATDTQTAAPAPPASPRRRGTILVAEDEPSVRDALRLVLERAGYHVLTPPDSAEAAELLESNGVAIDVLVSDVVMPGISGRDLARRAMAARPGLGIILLSGYTADIAELEELVASGARYAGKPLPPRDLLALVEEVLPAGSGDPSAIDASVPTRHRPGRAPGRDGQP